MPVNPNENLSRRIIERNSGLRPKDQAVVDFFTALLPKQPVSDIYYPGVGLDFTLDQFFAKPNRYYLDKQPMRPDVVRGDFRDTPDILDGTFSGVFLQDTHANRMGVSEILRTVKKDGLVIVSLWSCGIEPTDSMTNDQIKVLPGLREEKIIDNKSFLTFFKR